MSHSFDTVDEKVAEVEFFLGKMIDAGCEWFEFRCYLSAFLSASRSVTLALQRFNTIPGFAAWYSGHQERLKTDPLAKHMLKLRNNHVHGGPCPVSGGMMVKGEVTHFFSEDPLNDLSSPNDVVSRCRDHFIGLLEIVYDCYVVLGVHIDPQQYYTKEHFSSLGKSIEQAEAEIWGWTMGSLESEGYDVDDRWQALRSRVEECKINHLFNGYLGKVTPQPVIPERLQETDFTHQDRGWVYIPPGFDSFDDWLEAQGFKTPEPLETR